jgi:hypothetical protein
MRGMDLKEKEKKNKEEFIKKERDITMRASSVPTFNCGASTSNAAVWCYSEGEPKSNTFCGKANANMILDDKVKMFMTPN